MKSVVVTLLLCLVLSYSSCAVPKEIPPAGENTAEKPRLCFREDGTFRILNLSDFQDDAYFSGLTAAFIRKSIEKYDPDVIVLTGDNIAGYWCLSPEASEVAIRSFMEIFEEAGVPVAFVFGNHDDEGNALSKQEQMKIYNEYSVSLGVDEADTGTDLSGTGTYCVPVYESASSDTVKFVLWLFDSGSDDAMEEAAGYDHVRADQIEWYRGESARLEAENGGSVPGIAFQHVIVKEIYDALDEVPKDTPGAHPRNGKWYALPDTAAPGSSLYESPAPSEKNAGLFEAFVETGNVLATVSGHDHVNSFVVPYRGVDLICTPSCGFCSYGSEAARGARIFDISLDDPSRYTTETYLFTGFIALYDEVVCGEVIEILNSRIKRNLWSWKLWAAK